MIKNLDLMIISNIITVVNQQPRAEAIGVKGEKIVSVGSVSEVEQGVIKATQVLDLKGKTVLPGFIDSHAHLMGTGKNRLGVALAMQPMFITVCEGPNLDYYRPLIGDERVKRAHTYRSILNEEILVSGGSDTPVTKMNPLGGIHALVNHPLKEQRIGVYEAIEIFTINGAKIGFEEDLKGNIEPGKLADFAIISDDPYRVPKEKIGNIKVEMTIVGGKVVYRK
jgi:predicted amidohydrolase YtcJ